MLDSFTRNKLKSVSNLPTADFRIFCKNYTQYHKFSFMELQPHLVSMTRISERYCTDEPLTDNACPSQAITIALKASGIKCTMAGFHGFQYTNMVKIS